MINLTIPMVCMLGLIWQEKTADKVTIVKDGEPKVLQGRIIEEAKDENGLLFQTREGRLWPLQPNQIDSVEKDVDVFEPVDRKDYGRQLRDELGKDFLIHEAGNFVFVHNTEKAYASWVAGLYKRLEKGFKGYWTKGKGKFKLQSKPEFPLAVIIFRSRAEYERYMADDLGGVNPAMMAYYNLESNRVVMFDLTAREFKVNGKVDQRRINEVLSDPRALHMVATIIHEGTHQLMFNFGMQVRYSDTPLWLNEGMAMFFESPDLESDRGWRKIGNLNFIRLNQFLTYNRKRPENSLKSMIMSDDGFRNDEALDNYAQAWAFNYFLLKKYKKEFVEYLKFMSKKPVLRFDSPDQRLADFEQFFDTSLQQLDREFVLYFQKVSR